jgi:ADP-ribosyl-[dinitrogen reductase] hydrolase
MAHLQDRLRGAFYGTAIGDALGGPRQFCERDEMPLLTQMRPIANFKMPAGSWSDDTSMMLCLAEALTSTGRSPQILTEQLALYSRWHYEGHNTPTGKAFDVGGTTKRAIQQFQVTRNIIAATSDDVYQGNGSIMRIAPIGMLYWDDVDAAGIEGSLSSMTTHSNQLCMECCSILARMIAKAIQGLSKENVLDLSDEIITRPELKPIVQGKFMEATRSQIRSDGWVVSTLEAAMWAFYKTETFQDGAILAVNLAHDADTVGAVYGALAGAYYGYSDIPIEWLSDLKGKDILEKVYCEFEKVILG